MSGLSEQELEDYKEEQAEMAKRMQAATGTGPYSSGRGRD